MTQPPLPDLIPGFGARLDQRAEQVAEARRRAQRRRRRRRIGGTALATGLVAVSGAYATGLWRPDLGTDSGGRPAALDGAPPPELTSALAVLRRPQTDADRSAAAGYALRFPATADTGIYTDGVRSLQLPGSGRAAVLVPAVDRSTGEARLCLWVRTGDADGARSCGSAQDARRGRIAIRLEPLADAVTEAERARRRREAQGADPSGGGGMKGDVSGSTPPSVVVGVVPDGVRAARIGGSAPVEAADNVVGAEVVSPTDPLRVSWDD